MKHVEKPTWKQTGLVISFYEQIIIWTNEDLLCEEPASEQRSVVIMD